jgi:hypothetical protein
MTLTKLGIRILGFAVVAALATSVVVQQQHLTKLQDETQGLRRQAGQLPQLQAENEQLSSMLAIFSNNTSLSESQMRDLARLRAEVGKLRTEGDETAKLREENGRIRSQIGAPIETLLQNQAIERQNQCISNLTLIETIKSQWALENQKQDTDTPRMIDLLPYLSAHGATLVCPERGIYVLGAVGEKARCNIPGHELP